MAFRTSWHGPPRLHADCGSGGRWAHVLSLRRGNGSIDALRYGIVSRRVLIVLFVRTGWHAREKAKGPRDSGVLLAVAACPQGRGLGENGPSSQTQRSLPQEESCAR